ncbi:hypothetical protein C1646_756581 [Rhizophagus diaphanus]|nr:hypothetical protein C1646_756581 [Rhizophagus diaphanus] [Rhizophagus sp. MUCL 43196]
MSGSMNRNPSSHQLPVFKSRWKDGEDDYTEVFSRKNSRKMKLQDNRSYSMNTKSTNSGPTVMIEHPAYDKSLYSQAARDINKPTSSVENLQGGQQSQTNTLNEIGNNQQRDDTSMEIDKITDNQQSQKSISSNDK